MANKKEGQLVPYGTVPPGWEAEYTGECDLSLLESNHFITYSADIEGNVSERYSMWGFSHPREEDWNDEIRHINLMQSRVGVLDENIRRLRQHMAGLVCCHSGVPVTIDEILNAIGTGHLPDPSFHPGCWTGSGTRSTRPHQVETMRELEDILKGFLDGTLEEEFIKKYPHAKGLIKRTYKWLGSSEQFSELQVLLTKRILLHLEFFAKHTEDLTAISIDCFGEDGEGFKIDERISELVGLPKIYGIHKEEYKDNLDTITDADKMEIYKICGNIAYGVAENSECHHNTFRFIENWIYSIGALKLGIPTRNKSSEEKRLGRLLFGYALGLDKWIQGVPHQYLLLDLGHIDLGFDPTNEILRVYNYLGEERTPVKKWLAACLWYTLTLGHAGLYQQGPRHNELVESIKENGLSVREWIDSV